MAPKKQKPERTPVTARKRKKGVARRPPRKWIEPSLELGIEKLREMATAYGIKFNAGAGPDTLVRRLKEFKNPKRGDKVGWLALRHAACLEYVTSPRGITIKGLLEQEPFKGNVEISALQRWSKSDKWTERRSKFYESIRDDIKKSLGERLVDIQVNQLQQLDTYFQKVLDKIETDKPMLLKDKISSLVDLVKTSNELRDRIAKEIVPARSGGTQDEGMQVTPKLTGSEARAAAKAIMHERRAKIRAAATDSADEGDEKPQLRLVDGGASGEALDKA